MPIKDFYTHKFDRFGETTRLEALKARECPDTRIEIEWFTFSVIPGIAEATHVGVEVTSLQEFHSGKNGPEVPALRAVLRAVNPLIHEYRTALLLLDSLFKSPADSNATFGTDLRRTGSKRQTPG